MFPNWAWVTTLAGEHRGVVEEETEIEAGAGPPFWMIGIHFGEGVDRVMVGGTAKFEMTVIGTVTVIVTDVNASTAEKMIGVQNETKENEAQIVRIFGRKTDRR